MIFFFEVNQSANRPSRFFGPNIILIVVFNNELLQLSFSFASNKNSFVYINGIKCIQLEKKSIFTLKNIFLHQNCCISLILTVAMSCVVKLFITQRKLYKTLGFDIYQSQLCQSKCLSSAKSLFFLISSLQLFISTTAFFLYEAQTADEYGMSFYISITILAVAINATSVAWQIDKIFILMRNYEEFIDKS